MSKMMAALAVSCVLASCGGANRTEDGTLPENQKGGEVAGTQSLSEGDYTCTMTLGQYTYDPLWCVVVSTAGGQRLEKRQGSMTFNGDLKPEGSGFVLTGLWCDAACDQPIQAHFAPAANGSYRADIKLPQATWSVVLQRAPQQGAYGGVGYGGASYGGSRYGFGYRPQP